jgi:hypothetical protein
VDVKPEQPFTTPTTNRKISSHNNSYDELNQSTHHLGSSLSATAPISKSAFPLKRLTISTSRVKKRNDNPHMTEVSMPNDMFKSFVDWMHNSSAYPTIVESNVSECVENRGTASSSVASNKRVKMEITTVTPASTCDKEFSATSFLADLADHMLMKDILRNP